MKVMILYKYITIEIVLKHLSPNDTDPLNTYTGRALLNSNSCTLMYNEFLTWLASTSTGSSVRGSLTCNNNLKAVQGKISRDMHFWESFPTTSQPRVVVLIPFLFYWLVVRPLFENDFYSITSLGEIHWHNCFVSVICHVSFRLWASNST